MRTGWHTSMLCEENMNHLARLAPRTRREIPKVILEFRNKKSTDRYRMRSWRGIRRRSKTCLHHKGSRIPHQRHPRRSGQARHHPIHTCATGKVRRDKIVSTLRKGISHRVRLFEPNFSNFPISRKGAKIPSSTFGSRFLWGQVSRRWLLWRFATW